MKFGVFYEHQLPRPWQRRRRAAPVPGRARPGRARRPARLRLRLGGRAPLPRGVLALVRARGLPRRLLAAHEAHPSRARHRADAAGLQPPGEDRVAHRHARPRLERPRRLRHGRVGLAPRARGLRHRPGGEEGDVARDHRAGLQHARDGPVPRLPGQVLLDAVPQRRAEAGAEAAPAALGRLLEPRHDPRGRAARHRRAHLRLHRPERGAPVGARLLRDLQARVRADRPRREPEHRDRGGLLGAPRAGRGRAPRRGRLQVLRLRARTPLHVRRAAPGPHRHLGATSRSSRTCSPAPRAARSARRPPCAPTSSR